MFRYTIERRLYDPSDGKLRVTSNWNVWTDGLRSLRVEATTVTAQPDRERAASSLPVPLDRDVFTVSGDLYYFTYFRRISGGGEEQVWRYRNAISRYIPYTDYWVGNLSEWQYRFWAAALQLVRRVENLGIPSGRSATVNVPPTLFPYPHLVSKLRSETNAAGQIVKAYDYSGRTAWQRRVLSYIKTPKDAKVPKQAKTTVGEGIVFIRTIQGSINPTTREGDFYVTRQRTIVPAVQLNKTFTVWHGRPVLQSVEMITEKGVRLASLRFEGYREAGRVDKALFSLQPPYNYDGTSGKPALRGAPPYVEPAPSDYVNHPNPAYRRALRRLREVQAPKSFGTELFFGYKGLLQEQLLAFVVVENALLVQAGWSFFP